ncbi:MAG: UDP-3-O-(3-hydroxymyristoyl)glucosamine N-acyltransferase [Gammaproteobacteria bacterium]|nr:UDP-3-O-(3-hydroxymyristoyl)glucosamine N-acyltransferase [Gammaproteobacteria bacterium]MBU1723600.1 UDP-3-O-(3-hydroxymyristoyl)glucosamine N-acyltransferase [Gammaproteobacteria bacterium]MBU2004255.1 UDP-3-O-(3-hydroxymyristoyl)glucosamine N-acyltransferase [Gammaproteobacteria bacterium]
MTRGMSLQELAEHTGSHLQGDAGFRVMSVAPVETAQVQDISYIRGGKFRHFLDSTQAGALILPLELAESYTGNCLVNANPYLAYAQIVALLHPAPRPEASIHPSAVIASDAEIGEGVSIGAHVVLGQGVELAANVIIEAGCVLGEACKVGENTRLYPNVTLGYGTQVGERCIIHSGAVLGADGFGFAPDNGAWYKIPQVGNVVVGDDVEIGANTCIDRAALGATRIGNGVKLDNLLQIGHNVQIGDHSAIAACTAVAGSVEIGKHCQIGGMCAIAGHLSIADHVVVTGTSMVSRSITHAGVYSSGTSATENAVWRKNAARFNQLDKLARRLAELEKQLADLQNKGSN